MRKLGVITAAAVLAVVMGFAGTAKADIEVVKTVTGIDSNNDDTFDITDPGDISDFLDAVPPVTDLAFELTIVVSATSGQDLEDVVVLDRFGAELTITCLTNTAGSCAPNDVFITVKGGSDKATVKWVVGDLNNGNDETLTLRAETDITPGGDQSYTGCGLNFLNSGPSAKGTVERGNSNKRKQESDVGAPIEIFVATDDPPTECCDGVDNDEDGFIDFPADPQCVSYEDNDETNL